MTPFNPPIFVQRLEAIRATPPVQLVIALGPAVVAVTLALALYLAFIGLGLI